MGETRPLEACPPAASPPIIDVGALTAFDRMKWSADKFASRYPSINIRAAA
jgi:hypothetical protein